MCIYMDKEDTIVNLDLTVSYSITPTMQLLPLVESLVDIGMIYM